MSRYDVFVDSGAFIAFLDRSDAVHADARTLFATPPKRWCTSVLVVSEAYGWFLHRLGEDAARTFRDLVTRLPRLALLGASVDHHSDTERKLDAFRGHKLTYVDASSLVWLGEHAIATVWGTDQDLALEGADVVPGAPGA